MLLNSLSPYPYKPYKVLATESGQIGSTPVQSGLCGWLVNTGVYDANTFDRLTSAVTIIIHIVIDAYEFRLYCICMSIRFVICIQTVRFRMVKIWKINDFNYF